MKQNQIAMIYNISIFALTVFTPAFFFQNVLAQETNTDIVTNANTINNSENLTIGNLIYENKGEITSQIVLEGPTVQTSFSSNGTIRNGITSINVIEIGTYTTTPRANGLFYGEGEGVITGKNNEIVTWSSQEIGTITPEKRLSLMDQSSLEHYYQ